MRLIEHCGRSNHGGGLRGHEGGVRELDGGKSGIPEDSGGHLEVQIEQISGGWTLSNVSIALCVECCWRRYRYALRLSVLAVVEYCYHAINANARQPGLVCYKNHPQEDLFFEMRGPKSSRPPALIYKQHH